MTRAFPRHDVQPERRSRPSGLDRSDLSPGTAPLTAPRVRPSLPAWPALAALALACTPPPEPVPGLDREPRVLHFSPAHPDLVLRLGSAADVPLARIRIDPADPDWGAFTITDQALPRRLAPDAPAELHLRADVDHFAAPHADHDPLHRHRSGAATLTFQVDGQPIRVPLRFSPDPPPDPATWPRRALLAGLALLAVLRRWPWTTALPALACLVVTPLALGVCPGLLGEPATRADLLQCADGRGGFAVQLLAHPDALGVPLAALLLAGSAGPRTWRACALALFAALVAFASLDPNAVIAAQAGLRWGLWVHPLAAAALVIAAIAHVRGIASSTPAALTRLTALGLAALIVTVVLGGPDVPLPRLPHAATLAAGIGVCLGKLGLAFWALQRLAVPVWLPRLVVPLAASQILISAGSRLWAALGG